MYALMSVHICIVTFFGAFSFTYSICNPKYRIYIILSYSTINEYMLWICKLIRNLIAKALLLHTFCINTLFVAQFFHYYSYITANMWFCYAIILYSSVYCIYLLSICKLGAWFSIIEYWQQKHMHCCFILLAFKPSLWHHFLHFHSHITVFTNLNMFIIQYSSIYCTYLLWLCIPRVGFSILDVW